MIRSLIAGTLRVFSGSPASSVPETTGRWAVCGPCALFRAFNAVLIERKKPTPECHPLDDTINALGDHHSRILPIGEVEQIRSWPPACFA